MKAYNKIKIVCEICNIELSKKHYKEHLETQKHKDNLSKKLTGIKFSKEIYEYITHFCKEGELSQ